MRTSRGPPRKDGGTEKCRSVLSPQGVLRSFGQLSSAYERWKRYRDGASSSFDTEVNHG